MRFSIITPTYRRKDKLMRAVESARNQTYKDFEMIIVNDSPYDSSYNEFVSSINDARIHYHVNDSNLGVNYSRNFALEKISADSKWVIFLDDDDYLAPDALQTFHDLILLHEKERWFVTNRAYTNGVPVTSFGESDTVHTYAWEYLIFKRCSGDATHCIETKLLTTNHIRFSKYIKQAEEWFFFFQIGTHTKMFYHDHNSTITDGYDAQGGLNFRTRGITAEFEKISVMLYEGRQAGILFKPAFLFYILLRIIKIPLLSLGIK